ncbi:MAG TPA: TRAP transporter small permease [Candidatus Binatia bacterium]|nr:TRAP transporter small permease [Candidatus Binatia bacterium]
MKAIQRLFSRVITILEWWAMILLVLMVVLVSLGVFFRYVLGASLAWYDEFASYLLVWLTFYGAVAASYRHRHIGFEMVVNRFMPETRRIVGGVAELFVLGFQIVLFYYGWTLVQKMGDETAISLPWVKMGWVYSVLPIAGGLMLLISLERLFRLFFGNGTRKGAEAAWSGSSSE